MRSMAVLAMMKARVLVVAGGERLCNRGDKVYGGVNESSAVVDMLNRRIGSNLDQIINGQI